MRRRSASEVRSRFSRTCGPFRANAGGGISQGKPWANLSWPLRATDWKPGHRLETSKLRAPARQGTDFLDRSHSGFRGVFGMPASLQGVNTEIRLFAAKLPACFAPNDPVEADLIIRFIRAESQLWPVFQKYSGDVCRRHSERVVTCLNPSCDCLLSPWHPPSTSAMDW
jgi:hypothetical protein